MTDQEIWIKAGEIVATSEPMTPKVIIGQLSTVALADWHRVSLAIDTILEGRLQ